MTTAPLWGEAVGNVSEAVTGCSWQAPYAPSDYTASSLPLITELRSSLAGRASP